MQALQDSARPVTIFFDFGKERLETLRGGVLGEAGFENRAEVFGNGGKLPGVAT